MGTEPVEELPDDLEAWVAERAAAADASRAEIVRRLMAAHRLLDEHPGWLDDADAADLGDVDGAPGVDPEVDDLAERVEELEADLDEKIGDVRKRVIQVKREADAKAPDDHDHPSIERRIDEGFRNYEEILESLTGRTEALEDGAEDRGEKLRTVANAVVDLRRRMSAIEGAIEERAAAAELRETANRRGVSEAACGSCGESVHLGLLDEPACPHCGSPFDGVETGGWFRSDRLTVGDRPALESGPASPPTPAPESEPARPDARDTTGRAEAASRSDGSGASGSDPSATAGGDWAGGADGDGTASGLSDIADDGPGGSDDEPGWVPDLGDDPEDEPAGGGIEEPDGTRRSGGRPDGEGDGDR